jgi:hypothetical protein
MSLSDRRKLHRKPLILEVTVIVGGGGTRLAGKSADISLHGIFVELPHTLPEGKRVDVVINCPRLNTSVATSGTVVHVLDKLGVGIRFAKQSAQTRAQLGAMLEGLKKTA